MDDVCDVCDVCGDEMFGAATGDEEDACEVII